MNELKVANDISVKRIMEYIKSQTTFQAGDTYEVADGTNYYAAGTLTSSATGIHFTIMLPKEAEATPEVAFTAMKVRQDGVYLIGGNSATETDFSKFNIVKKILNKSCIEITIYNNDESAFNGVNNEIVIVECTFRIDFV